MPSPRRSRAFHFHVLLLLAGIEETTTATFDLKTAKLLAQVSVAHGHPVEVRLDDAARRLVLSGGGCDGYLPLDGSTRFIAQ